MDIGCHLVSHCMDELSVDLVMQTRTVTHRSTTDPAQQVFGSTSANSRGMI